MNKNEGVIDRIIRVLVGIALVVAGILWLHGIWAIVAYVLAAVSLITAATGFCGIYKIFKVSTLKK